MDEHDPFAGALTVEQTTRLLWKYLLQAQRDFSRRNWDRDRGAVHAYCFALSCLTDHSFKEISDAAEASARDRLDPFGWAA